MPTEFEIWNAYDQALVDIADYVCNYEVESELAFEAAHYCLMNTLACGFQALDYPACTKLMGPAVPGATLSGGARVPGTSYELDPVLAAFNIGAMNSWLDLNDTWLAAGCGHPSDNLGGILAHEIQGVLALENSDNRVGLDHVLLVRVATTAVVTRMLGGDRDTVLNAVSNAWVDGCSLRTYRHAPNTGSRKSWAAGDASSRAVRLALIAVTGEVGYPAALSAPTWGYYDVLFKGKEFKLQRPYGSYVMENVLFNISFPAEVHAQTAVEAGMILHAEVKARIDEIEKVVIETQEAGVRSIDELREKMEVRENEQYTKDYFDPELRYIGNSVQVFFKDGTSTDHIAVDFPVGHRERREEGTPVLKQKFADSVSPRLAANQWDELNALCTDANKLAATAVDDFMALLVVPS